MSDTGLKTAATVESHSGWGFPVSSFEISYIEADDSSSNSMMGTGWAIAAISDFSFGIPEAATINGIEVTTRFRPSSYTASLRISLSWNDGSSYTATETQSTTVDATKVFGNSTALWGRTWDDGELANGVFRLKVEASNSYSFGSVYFDYLAVTVYYSSGALPSVGTIQGLTMASVETVEGLAAASLGSLQGLT